jgi:Protein of unknown function (DUF4058)
MASLFPGMDPYLEFQSHWPDFHNALIAEIRNELGATLPDSYVARVDERIEVVTAESEPTSTYRPDVLIGRFEAEVARPSETLSSAGTATLEPILIEILDRDPQELRITWVEIRALPELELVTAIEVLSPVNKSWQGRGAYLEKRDKLHASRVNLVEIDLLLGGTPLPMKQRIQPGGYYTIVARAARYPVAEVYRWSVRDPLPPLPIPLRAPDADISISLAALVTRVYDLGRYARTLHHKLALPEAIQLSPEDRTWAQGIATAGRE